MKNFRSSGPVFVVLLLLCGFDAGATECNGVLRTVCHNDVPMSTLAGCGAEEMSALGYLLVADLADGDPLLDRCMSSWHPGCQIESGESGYRKHVRDYVYYRCGPFSTPKEPEPDDTTSHVPDDPDEDASPDPDEDATEAPVVVVAVPGPAWDRRTFGYWASRDRDNGHDFTADGQWVLGTADGEGNRVRITDDCHADPDSGDPDDPNLLCNAWVDLLAEDFASVSWAMFTTEDRHGNDWKCSGQVDGQDLTLSWFGSNPVRTLNLAVTGHESHERLEDRVEVCVLDVDATVLWPGVHDTDPLYGGVKLVFPFEAVE